MSWSSYLLPTRGQEGEDISGVILINGPGWHRSVGIRQAHKPGWKRCVMLRAVNHGFLADEYPRVGQALIEHAIVRGK